MGWIILAAAGVAIWYFRKPIAAWLAKFQGE